MRNTFITPIRFYPLSERSMFSKATDAAARKHGVDNKEWDMGYQNVLVTVAVAPDSHRLVEKAVSIVRPTPATSPC